MLKGMTAVTIRLVATDVAGLLHGEGYLKAKVINCTTVDHINSWVIANYNSSSVGGHYGSLFVECPSIVKTT